MLKLINLKNFSYFISIAILIVGFTAQPSTANNGRNNSSNSSCSSDDGNNGHGNDAPIDITLNDGTNISGTFDPSNPGRSADNRLTVRRSNGTEINYSNLSATQKAELIASIDAQNCQNAAGIIVSIEAPTVQTTQLPNADEYYVVDFNDRSSGTDGFSKSNGSTTYTYSSDLEIKSANEWGGAGGSKFITQEVLESIRSYTVSVNEDQKYFGFWWSAGDPYNKITFKKDGAQVAEFMTEDLVDFINSSGVSNTSEYFGNPAYNGQSTGHTNEPFSYVNIFFKKGSYDEIVVATLTAGGSAFESDNHTFSAVEQPIIGTVLPGATTPAAVNDLITTDEDSSTTVNVLNNDIDPNNNLAISKITINGIERNIGTEVTLASGALLRVESDGQTTYNPNGQFENYTPADSNTDTFTYTVTDDNGNSDTAEVTMKINGVADAPVAEDDSRNTDENSVKWIPVLMNDSEPPTLPSRA